MRFISDVNKYSSDVSVSIIDYKLEVVEQDDLSRAIFQDSGKLISMIKDLELGDLENPYNFGTQFFRGKTVCGVDMDIFTVNDGKQLMVFIYLLENKHQSDMEYFEKRGFTNREKEVALLVAMGAKNKEICSNLHISMDTLKSHINKIYKKLPNHKIVPWRKNYSEALR